MSENEKLNEINTLIEFNIEDLGFRYYSNTFTKDEEVGYRIVDVREIIFTQKFMDKLYKFGIIGKQFINCDTVHRFNEMLLGNLDKPVEYIYNTLGLGKQGPGEIQMI